MSRNAVPIAGDPEAFKFNGSQSCRRAAAVMAKRHATRASGQDTLTFGSLRMQPEVRFKSVDRDAVIKLRELKVGERVDDFGTVREIVKIEYTWETHPG